VFKNWLKFHGNYVQALCSSKRFTRIRSVNLDRVINFKCRKLSDQILLPAPHIILILRLCESTFNGNMFIYPNIHSINILGLRRNIQNTLFSYTIWLPDGNTNISGIIVNRYKINTSIVLTKAKTIFYTHENIYIQFNNYTPRSYICCPPIHYMAHSLKNSWFT
jgi:hypothetical protein